MHNYKAIHIVLLLLSILLSLTGTVCEQLDHNDNTQQQQSQQQQTTHDTQHTQHSQPHVSQPVRIHTPATQIKVKPAQPNSLTVQQHTTPTIEIPINTIMQTVLPIAQELIQNAIQHDSQFDISDTVTVDESVDPHIVNSINWYLNKATELRKSSKKKSFRDIESIIEQYDKAIEYNSTEAVTQLGAIYLFGEHSDTIPDIQRAIEYINNSTEQGNANGQYYTALLHTLGLYNAAHSYNIDEPLASLYYYMAATGQSQHALATLGYRYMYGHNAIKSCDTSVMYYQQVAHNVVQELENENGIVKLIEKIRLIDDGSKKHTGYNPVVSSTGREDDDDVVSYYQQAASTGDVHAQLALGQLHLYGGRGFIQNPYKAAYYLQQAATQGNIHAQVQLAQMYLYGVGVPQNNATALQLYQQVANTGLSTGIHGLGYMYLYGIGVEQNSEHAYNLLKQASDLGNADAQYDLGTMYFTGIHVDRNLHTAYELFSKSSITGHTKAMYYLAQMNLYGLGTLPNCNVAQKLYKQVAERGNTALLLSEAYRLYVDAQYENSLMYYMMLSEQGYEVAQYNAAYLIRYKDALHALLPTDIELLHAEYIKQQLTIRYLSYAAEQGNTDAMRQLGDIAFSGIIEHKRSTNTYNQTQPLYKLAIDYYTQGVTPKSNQNAQASFNLGYMYQYGLGCKHDLHLAKRHYDQCIQYDTTGYVPCKLASIYTSIQLYIQSYVDWITGKNQPTAVTETHTVNTENTPSNTAVNTNTNELRVNTNNRQTASALYNFYLHCEDLVLITLCCALGLIVYKRANPQANILANLMAQIPLAHNGGQQPVPEEHPHNA